MDKARGGRPRKVTPAQEHKICKQVEHGNHYGREQPSVAIAHQSKLSPSMILRILPTKCSRSCKPTHKPTLNNARKATGSHLALDCA